MPRTAREVAEGKKKPVGGPIAKPTRKPKSPKKKSKGIVGSIVEGVKAYGKKIESAMEERTGSESMRKKHRRKKK